MLMRKLDMLFMELPRRWLRILNGVPKATRIGKSSHPGR